MVHQRFKVSKPTIRSDISVSPIPNVVIVGGSFAGLAVGRHLIAHNDVHVIVVDPKDYFEYTPGMVHLLCGSNADHALMVPLSLACRGMTHVQAKFIGLDVTKKIVKILAKSSQGDSEISEIPFDALVICMGRPYSAPIRPALGVHTRHRYNNNATIDVNGTTMQSRRAEIHAYHSDVLKKARSVAINGGGIVGVELAAEIAHRIRSTKSDIPAEIYLISRSKELLNSLPAAAGTIALQWLRRNHVEVLLGEEISSVKDIGNPDIILEQQHSGDKTQQWRTKRSRLETKSGRTIDADVVIDCTGQVLTNLDHSVDRSDGSDETSATDSIVWPLNAQGYVPVDDTLQVTQFSGCGVFAAGDIVEHINGVGFACDSAKSIFGVPQRLPSIRNAHIAESQGEVCAHNVLRYLNWIKNQSSTADGNGKLGLLKYPQGVFGSPLSPVLSCVSLGPHHGIIVFNNLVLGGMLFGMLGGLVKFVIERSKVAEIRQNPWGRAFWAFAHVVTNALHGLHVWLVLRWQRLLLLFTRGRDIKHRIQTVTTTT